MTPGQRHMALVAAAGCCLGNRGLHLCFHKIGGDPRTNVHHIRTGDKERNDFATVGLCWGAHQGPGGIHAAGSKAFCRQYRPPGECELGLIVWSNEDIARKGLR